MCTRDSARGEDHGAHYRASFGQDAADSDFHEVDLLISIQACGYRSTTKPQVCRSPVG